ncbi:MAG TPA: DNA cytosine methyltransferase [Thermoplasmata archaeon]|nr:DNA cytosine methyltransferase [Thermoplasmata archaeon]
MVRQLTSADLFSGAGGLTEGFRQSGFEVLASLDNWGPAAETHRRNFPSTETFHADILEFDPSEIPRVDVLIGSPPCTEFSYSNRGGHGDLALGMRFVLRFLRFVHDVKPRYWAMENVPRLAQSLPPRIHLKRLGLRGDGFIDIPVRKVLNSADYGAPQKRLRLFSGKFPVPVPTHHQVGSLDRVLGGLPWVAAQDVLRILPDPLERSAAPAEVTDPNFGFRIPVADLSDHFMDTVLTPEEVLINRKAKTDHSWYGRMAFPDRLDRPARTVMATQTGVSRETLVMEWQRKGKTVYRRPTIRECAVFQTFPITYQFWGPTAEARYRLVGNAVPPVLSGAVARAIATKAGAEVPENPVLVTRCVELPPPVTIARRREGFSLRRFPVDRKFRDHLPGSRTRGFRVDVDNVGPIGLAGAQRGFSREVPAHLRTWTARLYVGSGKHLSCIVPTFEQSIDQLAACATTVDLQKRAGRLGAELEENLALSVPDATTLQAVWAGKVARRRLGPQDLLWKLSTVVDRHFPPDRFERVLGPISPGFPRTGRTEMPVRTAAFLFAALFATEVTNRRSPGETLGSTALEQFAAQSGLVLDHGRARVELPRAGSLIADAISNRVNRESRHASTALDVT